MQLQSVLTIVIIVVVILVLIWALQSSADGKRGSRRHRDQKGRGGCCGDEECDPPTHVSCHSDEPFHVTVDWQSADCDCDHYKVYIKYLEECPQSPVVMDEPTENHGCDPCNRPTRPCGKKDHDKVVTVPGGAHSVNIKLECCVKAVCVTVAAVSKCGKESVTCTPCTTCIDCIPAVTPCIDESDCRGLTLRWKPVECAEKFKVYYNDDLLAELPGDATGVSGLPPIEENQIYGCDSQTPCEIPDIFVQVCAKCGEGPKVLVEGSCHVPSPPHSHGCNCSKCGSHSHSHSHSRDRSGHRAQNRLVRKSVRLSTRK